MRWIHSTHLVQWADSKECESKLPELMRKLIISSCKLFPEISIPTGDSIYKPGWDGKCFTEDSAGYVPQGKSLWEFGRDEDFKSKCVRDFSKRTADTDETTRMTSTFVFVTPRRWVKSPMKEDWIASKKAEGSWKDIKIYDADDLECWLEQQPAAGLWLARELKKQPPSNIQSAQDYWQDFITTKSVTLTPDAVIAGREIEKSAIQNFLSAQYGILEVQASSTSEAIGCIIASVASQDEIALQNFFSRAIHVTAKEALKTIVSQHVAISVRPGSSSLLVKAFLSRLLLVVLLVIPHINL